MKYFEPVKVKPEDGNKDAHIDCLYNFIFN